MFINSQLSYQNGLFPKARPGIDISLENARARSHSLIAPNAAGVILMEWFQKPGNTGKIRAEEILEYFSDHPKSGVLWGISDYLKKNPTGSNQVDILFQSEIFDALGIDIGVESLKTFLRHIVMCQAAVEPGTNESE